MSVRTEWLNGRVAVVTIDRPETHNAIARQTMDELDAVLGSIEVSGAHAVVLRGAGERVFVSGGDLKELAAIRTADEAQAMALRMRSVLDRIAHLPVPVMAALNGHAYGGGAEVAVACDFRIAADDIQIAFNQVRLGIMPAWGGIERLCGLVGRGRAAYLMTTGRTFTATEAAGWGLVEEVVPRGGFESRWRELADGLAKTSRLSLAGIKAAMLAAYPAARPDLAPSASDAFAQTWVSDDHWTAVTELQAARRGPAPQSEAAAAWRR